jgi:hypothetical protein
MAGERHGMCESGLMLVSTRIYDGSLPSPFPTQLSQSAGETKIN